MGKIPSDRPSSSAARYNPIARPAAGASPASPRGRSPAPPSPPAASALFPHAQDAAPTPGSRQGGTEGESHSPGSPSPLGGYGFEAPAGSPEIPPPSPRTRQMEALAQLEPDEVVSEFWGYKLRTPHMEEAIRQAEEILPPNIQGVEAQDKREHGLVFHDHGDGTLALGSHDVGDRDAVPAPPDLYRPTARVHIHTHPYSPGSAYDYPSMADQLIARENPDVDFLVQIPAEAPGAKNEYIVLKGSHPPRFHLSVPNPANLPVPPHSPDGDAYPPFKEHPFNPYFHRSRFEENGSPPGA